MKCTNFANRQKHQATDPATDHADKLMACWLQIATAVARADNSTRTGAAIRWADEIAEAYSARLEAIHKELNK